MKRLLDLNVVGTKVFKEPPAKCPYCSDTRIVAMEILGAHTEPLLWECEACGKRMLRLSASYTNTLLKKAGDLFFDMEQQGEA